MTRWSSTTRPHCRASRRIQTTTTSSRSRAAQADYLVSGDRHLLDLTDPDPPVLTPQQFLELIDA
jgi:hypothetical protein